MGFLFRLILFVLIFSFIVYVLKMIVRLGHNLRATMKDVTKMREALAGRPQVSAEMVRCHSCGSFVAANEALSLSAGQAKQHYCSRKCLTASVNRG